MFVMFFVLLLEIHRNIKEIRCFVIFVTGKGRILSTQKSLV